MTSKAAAAAAEAVTLDYMELSDRSVVEKGIEVQQPNVMIFSLLELEVHRAS